MDYMHGTFQYHVFVVRLGGPTAHPGRFRNLPINGHTLRLIPNLLTTELGAYIESMDAIKYAQPMALQWETSPMVSEACVTSYICAQGLGAAQQTVLQMLPDQRDFVLQMVKQALL